LVGLVLPESWHSLSHRFNMFTRDRITIIRRRCMHISTTSLPRRHSTKVCGLRIPTTTTTMPSGPWILSRWFPHLYSPCWFQLAQRTRFSFGRPDFATEAMGINEGDTCLLLRPMDTWKRFHSKEALIAAVSKELETIPGIAYNFTQPMAMRIDETI
jgi:hypothetical protein